MGIGLCGRTVLRRLKLYRNACMSISNSEEINAVYKAKARVLSPGLCKRVLCKLFMFEATELQQRFILSLT